jgi:transketolase
MVVAQWETFDTVRNNAAEEAATLVPLYRLTNGMQPEHGAKLRVLIRDYAEAVIKDEWVAQLEGKQSSPARKAIGDLLRSFATLDPKTRQLDSDIDASFLQTVSQIVGERNKRGVQAQESLSWVMWAGAIIGGFFIVGMTFFLYMEQGVPHLIMSSLMAVLISILLIMIHVLSQPFVGPLALTPEPFEHSLQVFDDVDKGN